MLTTLAPISEVFSWRSPSFKSMNLDQGSLTREDLINLMIHEPRLIRRPILRVGNKVIIGGNLNAMAEAIK